MTLCDQMFSSFNVRVAAADSVRDGAGGGVGPARTHGGVARRAGRGRRGRGRARGGVAARRQAHDCSRRRRARHLEHKGTSTFLALLPTRYVQVVCKNPIVKSKVKYALTRSI